MGIVDGRAGGRRDSHDAGIARDGSDRESLPVLTALRFPAALLVFVQHAPATSALGTSFYLGATGVTFFFVLSGFILTYAYRHVFDGSLALGAIGRFYVARVARVYPVHVVTMTLMVAFLARFGGVFWNESTPQVRGVAIVAQIVLLQTWVPLRDVYFGANAPAWSISVEAFFYALFPFLAFACFRSLRRARTSTVLAIAAAIWAAVFIVALLQRWSPLATQWFFSVYPPMRLPDFTIGMLLAIAFLKRREKPSRPASTRRELYALIALLAVVLDSPAFPASVRAASLPLPFCAVVIYVFAGGHGALSRFLARPPLLRLGEMSFSFYLIHWMAIGLVKCMPLPAVAGMPLSFALALGSSFALFRYVEVPARTIVRRVGSVRVVTGVEAIA